MRLMLLLPLLAGCSQPCELLGSFVGLFSGDAEGDATLTVVENKDNPDQVDIDVDLGEPLSAYATATISCSPEAGLTLDVRNDAGEVVGEYLGTLGSETGEGTWSTTDGLAGTWSMTRVP